MLNVSGTVSGQACLLRRRTLSAKLKNVYACFVSADFNNSSVASDFTCTASFFFLTILVQPKLGLFVSNGSAYGNFGRGGENSGCKSE